jgi:hypothetical protein
MSIWGVNQSVSNPMIVTAGADVNCPSATETTVLSGTFGPQPGSQNLAIQSDLAVVIALGATPPTAMVIAVRVGSGADYDTWTVPPAVLVANANLSLAPSLLGIFGRGSLAAGATINVTVNPTGQAVTFKAQSRVVHQLSTGADS